MHQTAHNEKQHRAILQSIAHRAMLEKDLWPDFSEALMAELGRKKSPTIIERRQIDFKKVNASRYKYGGLL